MARKVTVASVQMDVIHGDIDATVEKVCTWIDKAGARNADVVVLPELVLSAAYFGLTSKRAVEKLGDPVPGRVTDRVGLKAKENGTYVIVGIAEKDYRSHRFYDTAVLIDRKGKVQGIYRKVHIYEPTESGFEPGDFFPVFDTDFGKIGMSICFDLEFPETMRILALQGAEVVFQLVANWATAPYGLSFKHPDITFRARAIENLLPIVISNRVGFDPDLNDYFIGRSSIVNAVGEELARAGDKEEMILAEVQLDEVKQNAAENDNFDYLRYRRPDLYSSLTKPRL